jgi:hypothetical protein
LTQTAHRPRIHRRPSMGSGWTQRICYFDADGHDGRHIVGKRVSISRQWPLQI